MVEGGHTADSGRVKKIAKKSTDSFLDKTYADRSSNTDSFLSTREIAFIMMNVKD